MPEEEKPFVPRPGQVDFTNIRWCPVINCVLEIEGNILIVKRSPGMRLYPNKWNGVSGFLDDKKSLEEKVVEELHDEVGVLPEHIVDMRLGTILRQDAPDLGKTWLVLPMHVRVNTGIVTLDWEAEKYSLIVPQAAYEFDLMPGFSEVLTALFP